MKSNAMTKADKAYERWYFRRFPDQMLKRSPMWVAEIDARDAVLCRQYHEIRRLKVTLVDAKSQLQALNDHVRADVKCDLICQNMTTIGLPETPSIVGLPRLKAPGVVHEWHLDDMYREPEANPVPIISNIDPYPRGLAPHDKQRNLRELMKAGMTTDFSNNVKVAALASMYQDLSRQFAVAEQQMGWWWRVPFGWWLKFLSKIDSARLRGWDF